MARAESSARRTTRISAPGSQMRPFQAKKPTPRTWAISSRKRRAKPEEVVAKLRQADVLIAQGQSVADAIRALGVTEVTYYRWRKEFGGLKTDQVRRMKDLEIENQRLRKAIADLTLDKLILQEAARGNF